MSKPLISVIIPSFNAGKTISHALSSIITQTFSDYEVVVMDGLSSDATANMVHEFSAAHHQIKFFSEKDNGIYDAMNKGIEKSEGKWLLFLGADDKLSSASTLERVSERLINTTAEFVYGNVRISGNSIALKDGDIYDGEFTVQKLFKKNISHQAIFYARSAFEKVGNYNTIYSVCADWDLNHRCFAKLQVEYINEVISDFSIGGLSTDRWDAFFEDAVVNLKRYYGISYFNPLFKAFGWTFYNKANKEARSGAYLHALYFGFFSLIHSNELPLLLKSYVKNIMNSWKSDRSKFKLL